jgi:hypothetical protein
VTPTNTQGEDFGERELRGKALMSDAAIASSRHVKLDLLVMDESSGTCRKV